MAHHQINAELSTLCYLEKNGQYLMLHRTVKKNDVNHDKWIGVGGHFEQDESPEECVLREVGEETGYTLTSWRYRGIVTFVSGKGSMEYMSLFTADGFTGTEIPCDEGKLEWVDIEKVWKLNLWAGDKIFFRLLDEQEPFFSLKLVYDAADVLKTASLNGKPMELFDVLDEDGHKTGTVQERGVVHREGDWHRTAHIWIARKREPGGEWELLLQKRSMEKDSNPGRYDISAAGHIAAGEERIPAALRELQEELGIAASESDLEPVGVQKISYEKVFYKKPFRDRELADLYLFRKPVDTDTLRLQKGEVEEVRWFPADYVLQKARTEPDHREFCIYPEEVEKIIQALEA